jgi:hypothetical protein
MYVWLFEPHVIYSNRLLHYLKKSFCAGVSTIYLFASAVSVQKNSAIVLAAKGREFS